MVIKAMSGKGRSCMEYLIALIVILVYVDFLHNRNERR